MSNRYLSTLLPPIVVFVLFIAGAEAVIRLLHVPRYLVPAPSAILLTMREDSAELWEATGQTAIASVVGFVASTTVGIFLGVGLSATAWIRRAFYPYAMFFQTV